MPWWKNNFENRLHLHKYDSTFSGRFLVFLRLHEYYVGKDVNVLRQNNAVATYVSVLVPMKSAGSLYTERLSDDESSVGLASETQSIIDVGLVQRQTNLFAIAVSEYLFCQSGNTITRKKMKRNYTCITQHKTYKTEHAMQ